MQDDDSGAENPPPNVEFRAIPQSINPALSGSYPVHGAAE